MESILQYAVAGFHSKDTVPRCLSGSKSRTIRIFARLHAFPLNRSWRTFRTYNAEVVIFYHFPVLFLMNYVFIQVWGAFILVPLSAMSTVVSFSTTSILFASELVIVVDAPQSAHMNELSLLRQSFLPPVLQRVLP